MSTVNTAQKATSAAPPPRAAPFDDHPLDAAFKALLTLAGQAKSEADDAAFDHIDAQINWDGDKIVLPANPTHMTTQKARDWLKRFEDAEAETIAIHEPIDCFPWDGAVNFMRALKQLYGWANAVPAPGFFGPEPPHMISVDIGPNERTTVLWGNFEIPGITGYLESNFHVDNGKVMFRIGGEVRKRDLKAVHRIAELTRQFVREQSIYRGHALKLATDSNGNISYQAPPAFMDLSRVNADELVFSDELAEQVETNLFTPIKHTQACRDNRVPVKRGILLEGPYGTGKTLCASVTAQLCERSGWTFLTVERVTALKGALEFAKLYQPCAVFVEDIDRETTGERTAEMDDILNIVDGIVAKGTEIMVIMTSNSVEAINRAMLRPGRLDAVLHIEAPDADAAEKLIRIYGRKLIAADAPLDQSKDALAGKIPAVIREAVERAKLYAISRAEGGAFTLADADVAGAARGMKRHLELLQGAEPDPTTAEHRLGAALGEVINDHLANGHSDGFAPAFKKLAEQVEYIHANL